MFKPDQFAANHNPKAEHLWSVKINWGIRDRMENTVGHAAYCLWVKTAPAPRSGIWVTVEQRTPHLCSCFHPAVSPGLLTLKPNMRAQRLLGKVKSHNSGQHCALRPSPRQGLLREDRQGKLTPLELLQPVGGHSARRHSSLAACLLWTTLLLAHTLNQQQIRVCLVATLYILSISCLSNTCPAQLSACVLGMWVDCMYGWLHKEHYLFLIM